MEKDIAKKLVINYLKILSYIKLKYQFKGQIISVAGCYGKSSAVSLLENIFRQEYKVYTTNQAGKGLNSATGIPFALLNIKPDRYSLLDWVRYCFQAIEGPFSKVGQDFLILEMGVDQPGDMKFLVSFIKSNIAILINSNNTHSVYFEELHETTKKSFEELIAFENGYIFEASKDAIAYNLDDPEVVKQVSRFHGKTKIPFSIQNSSNLIEFSPTLQGTNIKFRYLDEEYELLYEQPLLEEYKNTIEMVLKVAEYYKLKPESVITGLKTYKLPPSRCTLFEGLRDSFIIDSSYNSAYLPASSAIKLVKQISKGRKIAILGDMRELGILSEKEHRKLAHIAAENLDIVITVGPLMKKFFNPEFNQEKNKQQQIYSFETTKEALEFLSKDNFAFIQKDDVILIKGSQNTLLLEIIVEKLLNNKEDVENLCRRGSFYQEEREKLVK